jgi:hypothetical protein
MQQTGTWNFAPADSNRLRELLKSFGCADVIAPVDDLALGSRVGELLTRVAFGKRAAALLTRVVSGGQYVSRNVLKIDRVPIGGSPRVRMPSTHSPITLEKKAARP